MIEWSSAAARLRCAVVSWRRPVAPPHAEPPYGGASTGTSVALPSIDAGGGEDVHLACL